MANYSYKNIKTKLFCGYRVKEWGEENLFGLKSQGFIWLFLFD